MAIVWRVFLSFLFVLTSVWAQDTSTLRPEVLQSLGEHIHIEPSTPQFVGRILINDRSAEINQGTWLYVKSALDSYKKSKPIFIILELNTPGGQVYSAELIADALKEMDTQYNIPIVAYIDNWALSAGALLAYSCRYIAIAKDASMGAAEPVIPSAEGTLQTASEKINSAIRAEFANRAAFFGRNPDIAEAMVDKDIILIERRGKILKLDADDQIQRGGEYPDLVISPKGKLLTLNAEELMRFQVADILVTPARLPPVTEAEQWSGEWSAGKMALFHQPFFDRLADATITTYQPDWRIQFLTLLSLPAVSSILFLGLFLGFYMEMSTPGFGFAGAVALTCLFLILLSSFSLEAAGWLELILILVGLALIGVEVFVLPGFGVTGVLGGILVIGGIFALMLPNIGSVDFDFDTKTLNAAGEVFVERLTWLSASLVVSMVLSMLLARYVMPRIAHLSRLVLFGEQEGYRSGPDLQSMPAVGALGSVSATLRPSGKVIINDVQYDALSQGEFLEKGALVQVERVEGGQVIVVQQSGN